MRSFAILAGLLSLAGAAVAAPAGSLTALEQLRGVPAGWHKVRDPAPDRRLHFRIALEQPQQAHFEQTLLDVSTPGHPKYGQHLKRDELKAMLRPKGESTATVLSWLAAAGISSEDIEDDGEWINFYAPVRTAEEMLDTTFSVYVNSVNKVERIRTLKYSVPAAVASHITMIQPTTRFGQIRPARSTIKLTEAYTGRKPVAGSSALNVTACNHTITPDCLKALYNINYKGDADNGNKLGVCGYLEEYARFSDLSAFLSEYAPHAKGDNFTFQLINGGLMTQNSANDSIEANLDIQYTTSISFPSPNIYYSTGGRGFLVPDLDQPDQSANENEPYLDFLNYILKVPDNELPQTLTTSYGEDEQSVPEAYSRAVCNMFGQLGARGVSVIFSSGDTGVGSACQTNDGKNTTRFNPIFPAACPWVTSVGGTHFVEPEYAISFSSGGFSDRFPRPAYQNQAVSDFKKILGSKFAGLFNPDGRGFPDVAAQASNFHVIDKGVEILVGGTSAASPTFAGVISLLNSDRLSKNQPPLGFLNPWIYSVGRNGLTDIVNGASTGCTGTDNFSGLSTPVVPGAEWAAVPGWDPVTGWGTPNFQKLLSLSAYGYSGYGGY